MKIKVEVDLKDFFSGDTKSDVAEMLLGARIDIEEKEKKLLLGIISECSDILSRRSCNDIDEEHMRDFTIEEKIKLDKDYHEFNGDPEEHEEGAYCLYDFAILDYLSQKYLTKEEK